MRTIRVTSKNWRNVLLKVAMDPKKEYKLYAMEPEDIYYMFQCCKIFRKNKIFVNKFFYMYDINKKILVETYINKRTEEDDSEFFKVRFFKINSKCSGEIQAEKILTLCRDNKFVITGLGSAIVNTFMTVPYIKRYGYKLYNVGLLVLKKIENDKYLPKV
ncbi:hypothetical protein DRH14_03650 [Candidatus Shapirobacteria bacterium]|nr:MAG: hypothetical protein DRH14_03650 [Candidatus Shapirobacteria bacterium]